IFRIDSTMAAVRFGYLDKSGEWHAVTTLEEDEFPSYYHRRQVEDGAATEPTEVDGIQGAQVSIETESKPEPLFEGHREYQENQRGVTFEALLLPYLRGATEITIVDPYIRHFHQARNLMELIEAL